MNLLILFLFTFTNISVYSKVVPQDFLDSIKLTFPDTTSDSVFIASLVEKLFDYLENRGIIDPQIEVYKDGVNLTFVLKNEKITPVTKVYVDIGERRISFGYLDSFLRKGFFSKDNLLRTSNFFSHLQFFQVKDYRFLKSNGEYALVLVADNTTSLPLVVGGIDNGRFWLKSSISYTNLLFYPLRFSVDFTIKERSIQNLRGILVVPIDIANGLYLSNELIYDSLGPNYGLSVGKVINWARVQFFARRKPHNTLSYGLDVSGESPSILTVLRIERCDITRYLLFSEYEPMSKVGIGLVFLKTNLEAKFPIEGAGRTLFLREPYFKLCLNFRYISFFKTFLATNYYGVNFKLPTKNGILFFGLAFPTAGGFPRNLEINFALSKRSILFDYLSRFN